MEFFLTILIFVFMTAPIYLVAVNFANMFNRGSNRFFRRRKIYTNIAFVLGFFLSFIVLIELSEYKWDEPVVYGAPHLIGFHEPFSRDYAVSLVIFVLASILCAVILDRGKLLPPLFAAILTGGVYMGIILWVFFAVQLVKNADSTFLLWYLLLYPLNYIICAVRILRENIELYTEHYRKTETAVKNSFIKLLWKILSKASVWAWFPLICVIPVTGALMCVCLIFGQGVFGIIKAFTETSDWTFSTMISPPPIEYEGHYLCTVAVNGHEKLVKPTRLGIRHGVKIGVNRQLCIANAFEQIIEEKAPEFHKAVRHIYDKYGYPISKHITTKLRADIIYIAMKPLEWIFLIVLYLSDINPESRIALQYTGKRLSDFEEIL